MEKVLRGGVRGFLGLMFVWAIIICQRGKIFTQGRSECIFSILFFRASFVIMLRLMDWFTMFRGLVCVTLVAVWAY